MSDYAELIAKIPNRNETLFNVRETLVKGGHDLLFYGIFSLSLHYITLAFLVST